jgi:hypothetical protein
MAGFSSDDTMAAFQVTNEGREIGRNSLGLIGIAGIAASVFRLHEKGVLLPSCLATLSILIVVVLQAIDRITPKQAVDP